MAEEKRDPADLSDDPALFEDMSVDDFRRYGHQIVDWIAEYLSHPERYPVLSQVEPGQIKEMLPKSPPISGEGMDRVLADVDHVILPGITHWNHPAFFAYFSMNGSIPGILAEFFTAALNVNAMLWKTSPSATELEEVTLDWLRQIIGLPEGFSGVIYDTASVASLCAVAAARQARGELRVREQGLAGGPVEAGRKEPPYPGHPFTRSGDESLQPPPRLRLYASEHAHSSIEKAAITLGVGQEGVRKIAIDSSFRMDAAALARAIEEDRLSGWLPFCVVATVGATSTTSIDPVPEIADICEREGIWLHVDAAYGGSAAVVPEMRWVLAGCERADSFVINPHKWFFTPFDLSVLYCKRLGVLREAFSLVPEYLRTGEQDQVTNFMDYGPQLGRRFRALKLWFVIRYFGVEGLAARIRNHIEMAREFASWVDASDQFERLAEAPFSTVCFRAVPSDLRARPSPPEVEDYLEKLNERLLEEVNRTGKTFLSHTKLKGVFTIRLAVGHVRTKREHVWLAWEMLNESLVSIDRELRPPSLKRVD